MKKKILWQEWKEPLENHEEDENSEDERDRSNPYPVMRSGHGHFISLKIHAPLDSDLRFWVGHTNFDITEQVEQTIIQIPGIEIYDTFSPYRFRVGIGLNFNTDKVKQNISNKLCPKDKIIKLPPKTMSELKHIKLDLEETGENWAMFILPNGKSSHIYSKNIKDVQEMVKRYEIARKEIGGKILVGYK